MAFVLTYQSLVSSIKRYLERDDARLVDSIPVFIMLGQRLIARELKILGTKVAITDTFVPTENVFPKPPRWLSDSSFNVGTGALSNERVFLEQRAYEWCRTYWPDPTVTGTPKYYASDYNQNYWFVVPSPDVAYPYEILFYETPQLIDENNSTNFFTVNTPNLLLYASLLQTAPYLKDDDRIAVWTNYYEKEKQAISQEDINRIYDAYSRRGS